MAYETECEVAIEAVRKACHLCQAVRAELISEETLSKKDKSPVTVADFGAQAVINLVLARAFPEIPVVAEEDTEILRGEEGAGLRAKITHFVRAIFADVNEADILTAIAQGGYGGGTGRFWTLDPVDGTKGFLRGEQYAVALALIESGEVVQAVLGCPNLPRALSDGHSATGCLFAAIKGQGATMRGLDGDDAKPITVSEISDPAQAIFCESVEAGHSSHGDAARIAELLGMTLPPVRMDSQSKYGVVARGEAQIYLRLPTRADYQEKIWDHAAGYRVITEAGGTVTDVNGKPLDFSVGRTLAHNTGVIATNGRLHPRTLDAVRKTLGSARE